MSDSPVLLAGALLPDGSRADLLLADGRVAAVTAAGQAPRPAGVTVVDLAGWLVDTAFAEPHAHLDKTLTGDLGTVGADLPTAVAAWTEHSRALTRDDLLARGRRALDDLLASGVTAVRSHVNLSSGDDPLLALRAVCELRDEVRDVMTLQVVWLATLAPDDVVGAGLAAGADLLGSSPHSSPDHSARETRRILALAAEAGVDVDLHTDERLDAWSTDLRDLASLASGFPGRLTASHCVSLGCQPDAAQRATAREVARAGIGVVTCPQTNLALQGRDRPTATPRGLTAVRALLDAGARLAAGGDNRQDPFNPVGRGDPLEIASLLVVAGHVTPVEAWRCVTEAARDVMGLPPAGPVEGRVADLVAIRAGGVRDAVAASPADRMVWRAGRLVATTTTTRSTALGV